MKVLGSHGIEKETGLLGDFGIQKNSLSFLKPPTGDAAGPICTTGEFFENFIALQLHWWHPRWPEKDCWKREDAVSFSIDRYDMTF